MLFFRSLINTDPDFIYTIWPQITVSPSKYVGAIFKFNRLYRYFGIDFKGK